MNKEISEYPAYLFHQGTNYSAYDYMGAHYTDENKYIVFRVWAPNADSVSLRGDFNFWDEVSNPIRMDKITTQGIWEVYVESNKFEGKLKYKYAVTRNGITHLKADPYAFYSETLKKTASIFYDYHDYKWNDNSWLNYRENSVDGKRFSCPINIYEMHMGSWRTRDGKTTKDNSEAYLSYDEIADELIPYLKSMGYTHVELMPIMEHPFDGSWGYQICGYYAPTSRYGEPKDFMRFVDRMHQAGLGVILDWVPAHFPKDEHGLYEFDGSPLYEYQGSDRIEHEGWGTRCFDVGRNEVQSFLVSNAIYWLKEYHVDGLRIDAVASMLYLDYDRKPGEWIPNHEGKNHNLEAIAFFKKLNHEISRRYPDVFIIAEESTAWAKITASVNDGGLGFNYKWNMGWANDMFEYIQTDPLFRKHNHDKLTFSIMYAFSENFILPVSHDEVVHGKLSLIDKMFGNYEQKFAGFRVFLAHMMAHPGKKLLFMGCEYGQFREWDYENQLEWFMLDFEAHKKLQAFTKELNHFYLRTPELWENDCELGGFKWISADAKEDNIIIYERISNENSKLIAVFNFSGARRENYKITMDEAGSYEEIFNTEEHTKAVMTTDENKQIELTLAELSAIFIKIKAKTEEDGIYV